MTWIAWAACGNHRPATLATFRVRISTRPETRIFTTSHFDGYPAVLVRLDRVAMPELEELLVEAWLTRAPRRLAAEYLDAARNHARPERCPLATL